MHEIPLLFAQVAVVIVGMVAALAGIALISRVLWRFTSRVKPREDRPTVSASDFHRLETAVDAIAVEVERIAEGQRFAVALLSERGPAAERTLPRPDPHEVPASPPRVTTPH